MRTFKTATLLTVLLLTPFAGAVSSQSSDYDTAIVTGQSTTVGTFGEAVNFNVSAGEVDLPVMKPGETYTITIPVENTTDRAIRLQLKDVQVTSGNTSVESLSWSTQSGDLELAAGESGDLLITVVTRDAGSVKVGDVVTIGYGVTGQSAY